MGWAAGIERILLAAEEAPRRRCASVYVAWPTPSCAAAFALVRELRAAGARAEMEQAGRSMKGQLKQANRVGATHVVIVGEQLEVKDMETGEQRRRARRDGGVRRWMSTDTFHNPYRSDWCGLVGAERVGEKIRVAGWVHRRRDHGSITNR